MLFKCFLKLKKITGGNIIMTVERLIKQLEKFNPKAEVRLNEAYGSTALFALALVDSSNNKDLSNVVWIKGKNDVNIKEELTARFEVAPEEYDDELDFFMELDDIGYTLDDIKKYCPDKYEYSKSFMEDHGLI